MENHYRYAGTRPFLEKDKHLFFGRDSDKEKLTELIVLEELVVLSGKSGYGKSSLLNAGVIPKLRQHEGHEVFNIRLIEPVHGKEPKRSPLELLTDHLKSEINDTTFLTEKLDIPTELPADITAKIWFYAKIVQLKRQKSNATTLVFDQFEELSYFSDSEVEAFGRSMGALLNLKVPKSVRNLIKKKFDANSSFFTKEERHDLLKALNLKVVFSIHHDRLNLLDQLKQFLPSIFKYTYELKPLNEIQALEALHKPAALAGEFISPEFTYTEAAINRIFSSLKDKNQRIEPFQLQLIGQHAEEKIIAKKRKTELKAKLKAWLGKQKDSQEVTKFELGIKDLDKPETIFKKHYNKVIAGLPFSKRRNVRKLIENVLIMGGNRVPMPEVAITSQHQVSKESLDDLVDKRLLRSELNTVQATSFELSHDSLVKPILDSAEKRKRKRFWTVVIAVFLVIIAVLIAWVYCLKHPDTLTSGSDTTTENKVTDSTEVSNGLIINAIATGTISPTTGEVPLDVSFGFMITFNKETDSVCQSTWDFGDKISTSILDSLPLVHTYKVEGTYFAKLIVEDNKGRIRIDSTEITVLPKEMDTVSPGVSIRAEPYPGSNRLKFDFSATISEGISASKYFWKFNGDSISARVANPIHTFVESGEYDVSVDIVDSLGNNYIGKKKIRAGLIEPTVAQPEPPVISPSDTLGTAPFEVDFVVSKAFNTYLWKFPDGTNSTLANPKHVFGIAGTYDVHLTVVDVKGQEATAKTTITVKPPSPIAQASASVTEGKVPLPVKFKGSDTAVNGSESKYEWHFENDSITTEQNPVYIFNSIGTYEVQLTVTNKHDSTDTAVSQITVLPDSLPIADIKTKVISSESIPLTVEFDGTGSTDDGTIVSYDWDFGNGYVPNDAIISHTFDAEGTYKVKLRVIDDQNQPGYTETSIEVNPCGGSMTWLERFICVQDKQLASKRNSEDIWTNWRIPPDSLNIVGIVIPDDSLTAPKIKNLQVTLLFFFAKKVIRKRRNVYRFRIWLNTDQSDTMLQTHRFKTQRFNINTPQTESDSIEQAKSDAINQAIDSIYEYSNTIQEYYMEPDEKFIPYKEGIKKELAKLENKRISTFYTLFKYTDFDKARRAEIKEFVDKLEPKKKKK